MDFKYLLFYQWLCVNALGLSFLVVAFFNGWISLVISADVTYLVFVIFAVFLIGLGICGYKVWQTSRELNFISSGNLQSSHRWQNYVSLRKSHKHSDPTSLIEALNLRQFSKISFIKYISNLLVIMGLVGTVIGFIIALSGINPNLAGDISNISPMVGLMIQGMSTALYTTLVGAIFSAWTSLNYHILASGTSKLVVYILESVDD